MSTGWVLRFLPALGQHAAFLLAASIAAAAAVLPDTTTPDFPILQRLRCQSYTACAVKAIVGGVSDVASKRFSCMPVLQWLAVMMQHIASEQRCTLKSGCITNCTRGQTRGTTHSTAHDDGRGWNLSTLPGCQLSHLHYQQLLPARFASLTNGCAFGVHG